MAINLGRAMTAYRMKPGGKCKQCRAELEVGRPYIIFRNWRKGGTKQFFSTVHPSCVCDFINKLWENHIEKKIGRPTGASPLAWMDPVDKAIRAANLQRRRYLFHQMVNTTDPQKLSEMVAEVEKIVAGEVRPPTFSKSSKHWKVMQEKLNLVIKYRKAHPEPVA